MMPNGPALKCGKRNQKFRDEAKKLIYAGFDIGFSEAHGAGTILVDERDKKIGDKVLKERSFTIELCQKSSTVRFHKETLEEVLDWLIYFHCRFL